MRARAGVAAYLLGFLGCLVTGAAIVELVFKLVHDRAYPATSLPGLLFLALVCSLLLMELGRYLQGQAYGYIKRRGDVEGRDQL